MTRNIIGHCVLSEVSPHGEGDTPETLDFVFVREGSGKPAFTLSVDSEYCEMAQGTKAKLAIPNAHNMSWGEDQD